MQNFSRFFDKNNKKEHPLYQKPCKGDMVSYRSGYGIMSRLRRL